MNREKLYKAGFIIELLGLPAWLCGILSLFYFSHLQKVSPQTPDATNPMSLSNHGHVFYVELNQYVIFYCLLVGGPVLGAVLLGVGGWLKRKFSINSG